ncbi:hypothetical protein TRICI_004517 [Trichomonascus ciferrii]|uniref:Structure-specific endonuclease subunit SLX4 n=1 Tax=Trichomonascus ciferrii TaxID=44093 RepID=A0A642V714_9ASCO|nr:hypothetical protein TRICI_004517 [Trichomonascus ciferrii]
MEGPSVVAVDLEQFRCASESRRYRAVLEQGRLTEKENQDSVVEDNDDAKTKKATTTKERKKKTADPIKLLSGRPSRVRIQNELTSALKRTNGKGRRRKRKNAPIVSKVVDPTRGVEQIKQLRQVYPFSTCCGAHCKPRTDDRLVDLAYYLQPQHTRLQGLFAMTGAVPDDLTEEDVVALHDNDVQWSSQVHDFWSHAPSSPRSASRKGSLGRCIGEENVLVVDDSEDEGFWGHAPRPPGSASRRDSVEACAYNREKEDELGQAADKSVDVIDKREVLEGPVVSGCDHMNNTDMMGKNIIPDSQEVEEIADDSVEVIDVLAGSRNQSSPEIGFQERNLEEEQPNSRKQRLSIDSAFSLSPRHNASNVPETHSTPKSAAEDKFENTSLPELEESINSSREVSCPQEEAADIVDDSEAEDDIVIIPNPASATEANDSLVIQKVHHSSPRTALVISDSEADLDDMLSPQPANKQPIPHIPDSEDESNLELQPSPPSTNPQYESYTTKELRELVKQYGFKPVRSRNQMIQLLRSCHTQPTSAPLTTNTANIRTDQLDEMLYQQIDQNIKSLHDYKIYQQIISYEPIDILTLHALITQTFNIPVNLDETKSYCDLRGICFTTANDLTN